MSCSLVHVHRELLADRTDQICRIGADWVWPYNGYTDLWRRRRKEFHQHFSPGSIAQYRHAQEEAAQKLLQLLLASPEAYADHVQLCVPLGPCKA